MLICLWKGCEQVFEIEEADAFQQHIIKHGQQQLELNFNEQKNDGTKDEEEKNGPIAKKAKDNQDEEMEKQLETPQIKEFGAWTEQTNLSGKRYYYNSDTNVSQWEKPTEWKQDENLRFSTGQ